MSTCGSNSIFEGKYSDLLSDEKFIEFLISKLEAQGFGGGLPITLNAGNKINILDQSVEDLKNEFTISYFDVVLPLATISASPSSFEKGIVIAAQAITVNTSYTRKTYPLKSVIYNNVFGVNNQTVTDLAYLLEDDNENNVGSNALQLRALDTQVGTITVTDTQDNLISITATITRLDRWYWGVTTDPNLANINISTAVATGLGNIPSTIAPNVGNGSYVWVATIPTKDITDTTLKVSQVETASTVQLTPVLGYTVGYKVIRTDLKSGGTINLLIS